MNHFQTPTPSRLSIGITCGDAAGIGYELAVRTVLDPEFSKLATFRLYGAARLIHQAFQQMTDCKELPEQVKICDVDDHLPLDLLFSGKADARCGKAAYDALTIATKDALAGSIDAIVTAPMNKFSVNLANIHFTGHTEHIAELCGVSDYAMMQSAGALRVIFVTTHIALAQVAQAATQSRIEKVTRLLDDAIRSEGIATPKIAIAAINPHAGENGFMGTEDETVTKVAVRALQNAGLQVTGPFPPDTLFIDSTRKQFDGIVSMYHDQGHIPFKMLAFDCGVNSTMGLPIIRTSPDHGTAFDIAGRGIADPGSFRAALALAIRRAAHRRNFSKSSDLPLNTQE